MNALLLSLTLAAQVGVPPPPSPTPTPHTYNYDRAYRYFLNSPSGLKTFSSLGEGSRVDSYTPFSYQNFYRGPGYEHQRIGLSGWESYYRMPGYGGFTATPFFESGYRVPGYSGYSYTPPGSPYYVPPYQDHP